MKPKKLIASAKLAWLNEIGMDTHWLASIDAISTSGPKKQPSKPSVSASNSIAITPTSKASMPTPSAESVVNVQVSELDTLDKLNESILDQIQAAGIVARPVLGTGVSTKPRYMLIGEQPGLDDSAAGKPFVGDQAKLLQAIFKAVKLPDSDSCFMTHLLKYRLPSGVEPDGQQVKHNLQYLKQEIALVQPQNIIALGRVAASALLNVADVKGLRGQMHYYHQPEGTQVPLWISHQPVALLVHGARKDQAWRDFVAISKFNSL